METEIEDVFPVSPLQGQLVSDAIGAVATSRGILVRTKKLLSDILRGTLNPKSADKVITEVMVPYESSVDQELKEAESKLERADKELEKIRNGHGAAIVIGDKEALSDTTGFKTVIRAKDCTEKSFLELVREKIIEPDSDESPSHGATTFPVNVLQERTENSDVIPIFEIRVPDVSGVKEWQTTAALTKKADWPTIIPYCEKSVDSDEIALSLWTVSDDGLTVLEKPNLLKRAWNGSKVEYRAFAGLQVAIGAARIAARSIEDYSSILEDRKAECERIEARKKEELTRKAAREKEKGTRRKDDAKKIATAIKSAAKAAGQAELEHRFNEEVKRGPREVVLKGRKENEISGAWERFNNFVDKDENELTASQREYLTHGGGHQLTASVRTDIVNIFKEDITLRLGEIEKKWEEVTGEVEPDFFPEEASRTLPFSEDASDFEAVKNNAQKALETALDEIRIDKGPKSWLYRSWLSITNTVSKMKSIPLALTGMITVLTPLLLWKTDQTVDGLGKVLDRWTKALLTGNSLDVTALAAAVGIGVFFYFAHRQNKTTYYKDVKKARDMAKKAYVREMKKAVAAGYAHYIGHLTQSLDAWKRSPEALLALLDNAKPTKPTKIELLRSDTKILGNWKRQLERDRKRCDALSKEWKKQISEAESVAKRCGVFQ